MTKPVKPFDTVDPDMWVVWDADEQAWRQARLIRNEFRPEPLLVDDLGRRHRVDGQTRCQSLASLLRDGDLTQGPHSWSAEGSAWLPALSADVEDLDALIEF